MSSSRSRRNRTKRTKVRDTGAKLNTTDIEERESLIHMLSDDCLVKVFMFVPVEQRLKLESVCSRWYKIAKLAWHDIKKFDDMDVYRRLDLFKTMRRDFSMFYKFILVRCGRFLTYFSSNFPCDSSIVTTLKDNCRNLIQIRLSLGNCHEEHFDEAFSKMTKLRSIDLRDFRYFHERILREFQTLPEEMEEIRLRPKRRPYGGCRISPDEFYRCSDELFISTFGRFKALRSLSIVNFFITMNFLEFICQLESLVELDLSSSTFEESYTTTPSFSRLINLEKLTLHDIQEVDNIVVSISAVCKNLRYLDLSWTAVSDYAVGTLTNLSKLEELNLQMESPGMSDIGDNSIGRFRHLKKLDCYSAEEVTDDGMIELLQNSPNLEKLNVGFTSITLEGLEIVAGMTRQRENNIVLHINAYFFDLEENYFKAPEYSSPYLVITNDLYKSKSHNYSIEM